jgi:hypothetical protein
MKKVLFLSLILMVSCKKVEAPQPLEPKYETYDAVQVPEEPVDDSTRVWSAQENKLPVGVVIRTDCAHDSHDGNVSDIKDNYITIKQPNGTLTIAKDVDEDLFLNIENGDLIR